MRCSRYKAVGIAITAMTAAVTMRRRQELYLDAIEESVSMVQLAYARLYNATVLHSSRKSLDKDQAKTAERVTTQMHVVKHAAGRSGFGAVMHHRRHHQAIFQRQAADLERLEQQGAYWIEAAGGRVWH